MKFVSGLLFFLLTSSCLIAFEVDRSEQPATHPPLTPAQGEVIVLNPPPMIWRVDARAASYVLEISPDPAFGSGVIRVEGVDLPFYNHTEPLSSGEWYWRYFVVTGEGKISNPSPVLSFRITADAIPFPVPSSADLLAAMPGHPRIFTTPDDLEEFRARRHDVAADAWREVKKRADADLAKTPELPRLVSLDEGEPVGPTPGSNSWREGQPVRRQIFFERDGEVFFAPDYGYRSLVSAAATADRLSFAYLISGDKMYAVAARDWALFAAQARVDYHLTDAQRAAHDTVVYCYETGLKNIALTFDRIYGYLDEEDKIAILTHIEYHGEATYVYLRDRVQIHLAYQQSHPQQAMHALLTTALAVATDSPFAAKWSDYLVRQYANRIAWTSADGGYFEGQTYGHKFQWILEGLVAMRTATGIDAFQKPNIRLSGDFWLYCMSLNYWYEHGGDIYSLIWPFGNRADGYISNLMATMNEDRYVQWWSDTVFTDPVHIPFHYISQTPLRPKPPVDIPQARLFPETGQLAAFDRFYDHGGNQIFFRSSPWGGHSHAHADQNNFVIHAAGEIMAADVGYYTYYGDDYHMKWTVTTEAHNTILVNGQGQPKSIESKGRITEFFESPGYHFFVGDASDAYEEPLQIYNRSILFIRPDLWVVYDELKASEPSEYSWLLNTFSEADVDQEARSLVVPQREMRMKVDHLLPKALVYEQSNERRYPIQTRQWARFTEAAPEPWHTRVTTARSKDERILALLHTYNENDGNRVLRKEAIENDETVGLKVVVAEGHEVALFPRDYGQSGHIHGNGVSSDGLVASLFRSPEGLVRHWMVSNGSSVSLDGRDLFRAAKGVDVFADYDSPGASAQVVVKGDPGLFFEVALPAPPTRVLLAAPHSFAEARSISWDWKDGFLRVETPAMNEWVLWIDPVAGPGESPAEMKLEVNDSQGAYLVDLELAIAENGEWIAFGEVMPREPGVYDLHASVRETAFLIQDRFDPLVSVRGLNSVTGTIRDATEIFARFAPGDLPVFTLDLRESYEGQIVNYLRNGNFEEGIPGYPPRGWTMSRSSHDPDPGWPGWSEEDAFEGSASMKFVRPNGNFTANSQPMRLRNGGSYVLRFMAKGNATHARVTLSTGGGTAEAVRIEPSDDWREYRVEMNIEAGYTQIHIRFNPGGESDQIVWIDDMEFGPIGAK